MTQDKNQLKQNYPNTNISTEEFVVGSPNIRLNSESRTLGYLNPNDPATFRTGIGPFVGVIVQLSQFGTYYPQESWDNVFSQIPKIKEALSNNPDLANQSDVCSSALQAFHILNKIGEIDTEPLINCIKNHQLSDGGFLSQYSQKFPHKGNFSDLTTTYHNYFALKIINEKPNNITKLKEFIVSLQDTNGSGFYPYFFHQYSLEVQNQGNNAPTWDNTFQAMILLKELGEPLPFETEIRNTFIDSINKLVNRFDNYETISDKNSEVRAIAGSLPWCDYFNLVDNRSELLDRFNVIHEYYQQSTGKPSNSDAEGLSLGLALSDRACFRLRYFASPKYLPRKDRSGVITIRILNPTKIHYNFSLTSITCVNFPELEFGELPEIENYSLFEKEFVDIQVPYTLSKSLPKESNPKIHLTIKSQYYGSMGQFSIMPAKLVESQVYFDLNVTSNDKAVRNAVIGSTIGALTLGGGLATGVVVRRKKQKE